MSKKLFETREEMLAGIGWIRRWLVQQPFWTQLSFLVVAAALFVADLFVPDMIPFLDELLLGHLALTGVRVVLDDGPRYNKLRSVELPEPAEPASTELTGRPKLTRLG